MFARFSPEGWRRRAALSLVLVLALLLPACDSDDDGGGLDQVSGQYSASRITFVTDGTQVPDVDVLSRASNVQFRFLPDSEEFFVTYDFDGDDGMEEDRSFSGEYDVSGNTAELDVNGAGTQRRRQLLLPDEFDLDISGTELAGDIDRDDVNLGAFSEEDFGDLAPDGTLEIRLQQQ